MERKKELLSVLKSVDSDVLKLLDPLIDNIVFEEKQLQYLRTLPFIKVKDNGLRQMPTPASKQFKEIKQTYLNDLHVLGKYIGIDNEEKDSPLRKYFESKIENV